MAQRIFLSLLLASFWTIAGCDSSGPEDEAGPPALLPLDAGNMWVMEFTRTRVAEPGEGSTDTSIDTVHVMGDTTIAGERWTELRGSTDLADGFFGGFYTNREDGVWAWRDPSSSDSAPFLLYEYPAEIGATYELPGSANVVVTVLGTDAPINTPAGALSAYRYEFDTDEVHGYPVSEGADRLDRYLAPGQGFVSFDCSYLGFRGGDELVTIVELGWRLIAFETP